MSYDLHFYKKKTSTLTKNEIIDYFNNSKDFNAEDNSIQWTYNNEETGVYFIVEISEANTEKEDIEIWDNFEDFENLNFCFLINFIRPYFFAYEIFPMVDKIVEDLDIYLLNAQDSIDPDNPQKFEKGYLEHQYIKQNEGIIIENFEKFNLDYFEKEKSDFIWKYSVNRVNLQDELKEDIFVAGYLLLKNKSDNKIYSACVWPCHIPIILPPVDYVIIQKSYKKLFRKVQESGLVSIQQIDNKFGSFFESFSRNHQELRVLRQQNADKISKEFNKLQIEYQVKEFGEFLEFDKFVNVKQ